MSGKITTRLQSWAIRAPRPHAVMVNHRDGGPDNRIYRRGGRRRERQSAARRPGDVDRFRRARGTRERPRRRLRGCRSGGRRLPRHGDPIGLSRRWNSQSPSGRTRPRPCRLSCRSQRLLETVSVVAEEPRIFARNVVAEPMMMQQSNITAVTSVVDNLPGVSVQEGDAYGFDDWSSNVAMRGFQVTINEAQIGTTVDGFPNGTSDYWGGSKANRFIDPMNLGRRRGLAGDGRHRLAVGRGAGRHVRLPDGRSGGGADLHRVVDARRERRPAVLHAGRHRTAVRPRRDARLDRRRAAGGDRLGGGLRTQRAGAPRRQARLGARASGPDELPLVRQHPRGCVPAALQRGRLPRQLAVGPPDRRVARRPVSEPVLPAPAGRPGGTTRSAT